MVRYVLKRTYSHPFFFQFIRKLMPKDERYCDLVTTRSSASSPLKLPAASAAAATFTSPTRPRALSLGAARELALTLKRHLELERELDRVRAALVNRPDFSIHKALSALDHDRSGQISAASFRQFLLSSGVCGKGSEAEQDAAALLARYDKQGRGMIRSVSYVCWRLLPSRDRYRVPHFPALVQLCRLPR
jgi:hypothetical protein